MANLLLRLPRLPRVGRRLGVGGGKKLGRHDVQVLRARLSEAPGAGQGDRGRAEGAVRPGVAAAQERSMQVVQQ